MSRRETEFGVRYLGREQLTDPRDPLENATCELLVIYGIADGVDFEEYELDGSSMSYDELKAIFGDRTEYVIELARANGERQ